SALPLCCRAVLPFGVWPLLCSLEAAAPIGTIWTLTTALLLLRLGGLASIAPLILLVLVKVRIVEHFFLFVGRVGRLLIFRLADVEVGNDGRQIAGRASLDVRDLIALHLSGALHQHINVGEIGQ